MLALWCVVGSSLLVGGLFFFFSFIFEFAKHQFFLSEEALALGICMFLVGFYIMSRVLRAAQRAGLDNGSSLAWAPVYCPGFVCHMCCTSRSERKQFVERRCGGGGGGGGGGARSLQWHDCLDCCCCLDSDQRGLGDEVAFNRVFANEEEWEEELQRESAVNKARERTEQRYKKKIASLLSSGGRSKGDGWHKEEDWEDDSGADDVVLNMDGMGGVSGLNGENNSDDVDEAEFQEYMEERRRRKKRRKKSKKKKKLKCYRCH